MKPIKPEDVGYTTDLDSQYRQDLEKVTNDEEFENFKKRWDYWLDEETKKLTGWDRLKPFIDDGRKEGVELTEKHTSAMFLLMPERLFEISIQAMKYKVPWGLMYIRLKEDGKIDY